jgi:hypothetical protein
LIKKTMFDLKGKMSNDLESDLILGVRSRKGPRLFSERKPRPCCKASWRS